MSLKMDMTSVLYMHTQRFVAELQAFFRHFSQLQKLLGSIRSAREVSICFLYQSFITRLHYYKIVFF